MWIITAKWLRAQGACDHEVKIVEREWPQGGRLTRANIERAVALGLSVHWLGTHILSLAESTAYEAACRPHLDAYEAGCRRRSAYEAACAAALCAALGL